VTDARALNGWRRLGYRVLPGELFSYILHLRPAEWPIMAAHTALGYVLAVGLGGVGRGTAAGPAALGLLLWVVCLNGGTLALNSAFDRDDGDIGYLTAPPPPPRHLLAASLALLCGGQALACLLPAAYRIDYAVCFLLSLLYSAPPARLKAVAGLDWIVNMWGFGTLTPLAGWAATGRGLGALPSLVLGAFCPLFAGLYPLTQLYQLDEDRRRGDRTLALRLGERRSLALALGCTGLAFGLFGAAAWVGQGAGWAAALLLPLAAWVAVLVPWYRGEPWTSAAHQRGMYRALGAWALTDLAVVAVFAH